MMASEHRTLIYFDELVMALARTYRDTMDTHIYSPRDIMSSMQGLRPVDAVEVVRCKDCKHWQQSVDGITKWCPLLMDKKTNAEDFCSYGERGEGE